MRFIEAYEGYQCKRLSQEEAARLLVICPRTLRRYLCCHEASGLEGLLNQPSHRKAPADEAMRRVDLYVGNNHGCSLLP
ncbi:helix-turn-helix domain-containing protein [Candidatus Spongiihabitans sp.]|uniref:helix-turn-helix domain-containing protein n=1 Tax=Candidatus Spongiihabitans sp. TaxID=3101308 RepID=UPI003C79C186